jgi:hypothetical protein
VSVVTQAAIVFALVTAGAIAFQVALALGAPWGRYAMGGRYPDRLPPAMRVSAVVQALVLVILAIIVLADAGIVLPQLAASYPWLIWVVVMFSTLSTLLNAITRSTVERRIWLPVALVMLASSLVVAIA